MSRKPYSKTWLILSLLVFLLTCAYFGVIYFSHDLQRFGMLFNADSLYLPALLNNLLYEHGAWQDWTLPPAPYFFPDLPLYLIAYVISQDAYLAQFIFALLQGLLVGLALYGLNRLFFSRTQACLHTTLVLALLYLSVMGHPTIHAIISGHHFGAFISLLIGLYVFAQWLNFDGQRHALSLILIILTGLTVAADKLFIVQFILPVTVVLSVLHLINRISKRVFLLSLVLLVTGLILGYGLHYLWVPNPTRFSPQFGFHHWVENLPVITGLFIQLFNDHFVYTLIFVVFYGLLAYQLAKYIFTGSFPDKSFLMLCLSVALISVTNIVVIALSNLTIDFRYFIPVLFMPLLLLPLLLILLPTSSVLTLWIPRVGLIVIGMVLCVNVWQKQTQPLKFNYYPPAVQCFDEFISTTQSQRGIAHYWDAKRTMLLSKNKVSIAAYTPDLVPYNWISTSQWQHQRYDFVLIMNNHDANYQLDLARLKAYSPKQINSTFSCGLFDVHYFPQGLYTTPGL